MQAVGFHSLVVMRSLYAAGKPRASSPAPACTGSPGRARADAVPVDSAPVHESAKIAAPRRLLSFEFAGLCVVAFLSLCNVTVFYNLFGYLASLGVPASARGLLVGAAALTAMVLYLVASPFVGRRRAPAAMFLGMAVLAASG